MAKKKVDPLEKALQNFERHKTKAVEDFRMAMLAIQEKDFIGAWGKIEDMRTNLSTGIQCVIDAAREKMLKAASKAGD